MRHISWKAILSFAMTAVMLSGIFSAISLPIGADDTDAILVNLFDAATAESGHYHPTTNKYISSSFCTNTIEVQEGDVITFGPVPRSGQDFFVIGYDASGNIVSTDFQNRDILTVADTSFRFHYLYCYTVPANVTKIRLTVPNDLKTIFTVTKNRPFDAFDFYKYWNEDPTRAAAYLKTPRTNALWDGYSGQPFKIDENSILKGRSVLFLGDSIVSSQRDTSLFYCGWADRIGIVNGMNYINKGKSGTSMSTKKNDRIITYLKEMAGNDYDYIITNGGVNDAWVSAPVGTVSNGFYIDDFDTSTFAGALEEFFFFAREIYPDSIIGYICTFSMPAAKGGNLADMSAYYDVAKQICKKWDVHCLDIYNNTEFCKNVLKTHTTQYMADNVHPNGAGVDLIYPLIEEWMKSLPHPDNPKQEEEFLPEPEEPFEEEQTTKASEANTDGAETTEKVTANEEPVEIGCASAVAPMVGVLATVAAGAALTRKKRNQK